jgi:hypothetical protein
MKRILVFAALLALSGATLAAGDVVATIAVKKGTTTIYSQTTTFHNVTDAEAAMLEKSARLQLNAASQRQNKTKCAGCDWSIEWTWGSQPTIVTENMSFIGVNKTLREGVRWLDDRVTAAEINRQRGKVKPWGN